MRTGPIAKAGLQIAKCETNNAWDSGFGASFVEGSALGQLAIFANHYFPLFRVSAFDLSRLDRGTGRRRPCLRVAGFGKALEIKADPQNKGKVEADDDHIDRREMDQVLTLDFGRRCHRVLATVPHCSKLVVPSV